MRLAKAMHGKTDMRAQPLRERVQYHMPSHPRQLAIRRGEARRVATGRHICVDVRKHSTQFWEGRPENHGRWKILCYEGVPHSSGGKTPCRRGSKGSKRHMAPHGLWLRPAPRQRQGSGRWRHSHETSHHLAEGLHHALL